MEDASPRQDVSASDLRWALAHERFETLYQPIVRVHDRKPVALEALARLNHPERGTIEPDRFVPQMEDAGLALPLADQITAQAFSALPGGFLEANHLSLAINLPLDVLLRPDALSRLDAIRQASGVPRECLTIELTESQPVTDIAQLEAAIHRWRDAGYALALDDVGPNMPKHRALLGLPFTTMKLDKGAIFAGRSSQHGRAFLETTIAAAKARGLHVVAEGIEDQALWDMMAEIGADQVQGFLIARPLSAADLTAWIKHW